MRRLIIGPKPGEDTGDAVTLDVRPGIAQVTADVRGMPFPDAWFDEVLLSHVLEHLERDQAPLALAEIRRVLKPEGRLEIAVPDMKACARSLLAGNTEVLLNIYSPHEDSAQRHRWGYTPQTLARALMNAGFLSGHPIPATEPHEIRMEAFI
jgi:predicted SAM-dependent methyltransferase